eukprot:6477708-Amphidinium_carterae.3
MARRLPRPNNFKPTHRLTGKQRPPIVAQLDDISLNTEITLENNEDKEEQHRMETSMKDIQVQTWWQYEDDITIFSEHAIREAEQGACTFDQQAVVQGGPRQDTHTTTTTCVCYKMGDHTTTN